MSWEEVGDRIAQAVQAALAETGLSSADRLDRSFEIFAAYRAARLKQPLAEKVGDAVASGPFAGMRFLARVAEGAYIPKLLGSYEAELHPRIERICAGDYKDIVNIGCAEGYYAVGLARRLPGARIHAHDTDDGAQDLCRDLAERNGVTDRVAVAGEFRASDFAAFAGRRALVLCDIEGAEVDLLDPKAAPALGQLDLLVEIHYVRGRWTSEALYPRFAETHRLAEIRQAPRCAADYPALEELSPADQFFALLERVELTRWAWFEAIG